MVLPTTNPETGHSISCNCNDCMDYFELTNLKNAVTGMNWNE